MDTGAHQAPASKVHSHGEPDATPPWRRRRGGTEAAMSLTRRDLFPHTWSSIVVTPWSAAGRSTTRYVGLTPGLTVPPPSSGHGGVRIAASVRATASSPSMVGCGTTGRYERLNPLCKDGLFLPNIESITWGPGVHVWTSEYSTTCPLNHASSLNLS